MWILPSNERDKEARKLHIINLEIFLKWYWVWFSPLFVTKNCTSFDKSHALFSMLSALLYHVHWMVGLILNKSFSCSLLCRKARKNIGFWLQKRFKIQNPYHFWKLWGWLYNDSTLIFDVKSLWKDPQPKSHFSLAFYA